MSRLTHFKQAALVATTALSLLAIPGAAVAQDTRDSLFQAMLADPNNPEKMLAFARAATAERDYEAVVSTLERLLDIEPGNTQARFELGVAYYALGSYELAEFHLRLLQEQSPGGARAKQAGSYLDRIDGRKGDVAFRSEVAAGIAFTNDGTAAALQGRFRWRADLGASNDHTWQTDLLFTGYAGEDDISTARLRFRTGPRFSADGLGFGVRIRPYVEYQLVDDDDGDTFSTVGLGAQYFNAHSAQWSSFADLKFGSIMGSGGASDGSFVAFVAGASYTPSRDMRFRLSVFASDHDADVAAERYERVGLRAEIRRAFSNPDKPGKRPSIATAYLQHSNLDYAVGAREDDIASLGGSYRTFLNDDVFIELGGRYTKRNSTVNGFDDSRAILSLLVGREF